MLSNYLSAALRNFGRNRAYSLIVTLSLAIGFAAMMLAAIYSRYEHSYDRAWPNADRIYLAVTRTDRVPGTGKPAVWGPPPEMAGALIQQSVTGVEEVTRLHRGYSQLRTERTEAEESTGWADSNFFEFFPPTLVSGDLKAGLRPGAVVLTRSLAEKYFGRVDVIGRTLTLEEDDGARTHAPQVAAVIEDWPVDSHMEIGVILGKGSEAGLSDPTTYFRVSEGVSLESLNLAFGPLSRRVPPMESRGKAYPRALVPMPLSAVYMLSEAYGREMYGDKYATVNATETFLGLAGLMLAVSAINFINLMTARGAGRALEVGVRKVVGARRRDLLVQFVSEGVLYATFAFVVALALVEIARPLIVSLTGQPLPFDYGASLSLLALFALGAIGVGIVASLYPALVLSGIRPIRAIRNEFGGISGSPRLRQTLVVLQFIPLLILAGGGFVFSAHAQTELKNALKLAPKNAMVLREPCNAALKAQLSPIPGVASVTCLEMDGFGGSHRLAGYLQGIGAYASMNVIDSQGGLLASDRWAVDARRTDREALRFYDARVVAGELWTPADERGVVLNEAAAALLGHPARSVIGQQVAFRSSEPGPDIPHSIVGVISNRADIPGFEPTAYLQFPASASHRKLVAGLRFEEGADLVALTAMIDKTFETANGRPPRRTLYRDDVMDHGRDSRAFVHRLTACVVVGLLVAAAGIFAMAVFLANRRTREIGVRMAFGASRASLLRMLIFQFTKPVLIANLVAMPVVLVLAIQRMDDLPMAQRSTLALSSLAIVVVGSLVLTFLATFAQAWRVTGKLPLKALRSE